MCLASCCRVLAGSSLPFIIFVQPDNILFAGETYRGEKILKVCDLGIVTERAISNEENEWEVREFPAERTFAKGTKMYMAPEQVIICGKNTFSNFLL